MQGTLESGFIEKRRVILNNFCQHIQTSDYLSTCQEYKVFNSANDLDKEFKKPQPSYDLICQKYKFVFEDIHKVIKIIKYWNNKPNKPN